jgi:membrane associated rhomboid family serine protease
LIPLSDDNRAHRFPFVTITLIVVNVLVFFFWQVRIGLNQSVMLAGFVPDHLAHGAPGGAVHLFTAMFLHGGLMHLLGNMWFLWIFGDNVEDETGPVRFLVFYLLTGAIATLAHFATAPHSAVPLVGASGAISGVLGGYLVRHPRANIRTLIPLGIFIHVANVPAFVFLFIWMGLQVLSQAMSGKGGSGVAYLAHIGGFIAGVVLIRCFHTAPRRRRGDRSGSAALPRR